MRITFWKDNLLKGEHEVEVGQIIADFRNSDHVASENYRNGWPFERAISLFMMDTYGGFDPLTENQLRELFNENQKIPAWQTEL
jgi:hypothetical protein